MTLTGEPGPSKPRGTRTPLFAFHESQLCSGHSLLYPLAKTRLIFPSTISAFSLCHIFFFQSPSFLFTSVLASTMVHPGPSCPHNILSHSAYTVWFFGSNFPKGDSDRPTRFPYIFVPGDFESRWQAYTWILVQWPLCVHGEGQRGKVVWYDTATWQRGLYEAVPYRRVCDVGQVWWSRATV